MSDDFPNAPIFRSTFILGDEVYPQRWANGIMRFKKVIVGYGPFSGRPIYDLEKTWVPDVEGEEPRRATNDGHHA